MSSEYLGPHYKIHHPLNTCNIKGDPYSSSIINIENTYLTELMSRIRNGEVTFGGWYQFKYNPTPHSLDLVLFQPVDETTVNEKLIMRISETEIVI